MRHARPEAWALPSNSLAAIREWRAGAQHPRISGRARAKRSGPWPVRFNSGAGYGRAEKRLDRMIRDGFRHHGKLYDGPGERCAEVEVRHGQAHHENAADIAHAA